MIIKLDRIISCSSEHPSYPASNLLEYTSNSSWRCAKPGEMLATVIFQLAEPSTITGLDIGNYRSCVVIVTASTSSEPDNWVPIINHQFLSHDEAANGKFRDQVQLFTKKELNPDTLKVKFDRVKVTCMQSANLKELFGLSFIQLKTEVVVDLGLDVFGRFKLKQTENDESKPVDEFKNKYLRMIGNKTAQSNYKNDLITKIKENGMNSFAKRQEENREPMKRPLLEKLEAGKADEVFGTKKNSGCLKESDSKEEKKPEKNNGKPVARTPFGDVIPSTSTKENKVDAKKENQRQSTGSTKRALSPEVDLNQSTSKKRQQCSQCAQESEDKVCKNCNRVCQPKPMAEKAVKKKVVKPTKQKKPFSKLFEDVSFSLSGYVNPQRDEIRKKALQMGGKYIANPNTANKNCSHLICAFKNTPKYQQLKGHSKIVSHAFIEDCFDQKKRLPWRRYALDDRDKNGSESEEEILGSTSPPRRPNPFQDDTDSDSN